MIINQPPTQLAGRLKHFLTRWEKLTSDPVILEFVKGVKIEFQSGVPPTQHTGRTSRVNAQEQGLVECEIEKLLQKGVIVPSVHEAGGIHFHYLLA